MKGDGLAARRRSGTGTDLLLLRLHEYNELVAASARSSAQHDRIVRAAALPVTGSGLSLLGLVARHGPVAVGEVARRVGVNASTASRQLRPLEELELIVRELDPADARIARFRATPAGARALERAREVMLNDYRVATRDWAPADRERLAELLATLRADLVRTRADESGWSIEPGEGQER